MTSHLERVIVLVDMDCFYCQVEEKLNPHIKGKPLAVVQYNAWRGGGIIAVNYAARDRGVTRHMRGDEAKQKCPEIELVHVPAVRGKADLTRYRNAGKEVAAVLQEFSPIVERASVDEAYLDITQLVNEKLLNLYCKIDPCDLPNTHIVGYDLPDFLYDIYSNDCDHEANLKLAIGGIIVEEIRAAVYEKTEYRCSAGIAHNKILAKLSCGLHKPNQQTILPHESVKTLYEKLSIKKIKSLGGKFGEALSDDLNIATMAELEKFTEKQLQQKYDEKTGTWLYKIARGIDNEPVTARMCSKSIGCCKKFPGKTSLVKTSDVYHWLNELASEVHERLTEDRSDNRRVAKQMVVSYALNVDKVNSSFTRSKNLPGYDVKRITDDAYDIVKKANAVTDDCFKYPITFLGISAGKFEDCKNVNNIQKFFKKETVSDKTKLELNVKKDDTEKDMNEADNQTVTAVSHSEVKHDTDFEISEVMSKCDDPSTSFFTEYFKNYLTNQNTENNDNEEILEDNENENSLDSYESCNECGNKILKTELQTHRDYHMALQIAKNQNNEENTDQSNRNGTEDKHEEDKRNNSSKLHTFLLPKVTESDDTEMEICNECQKSIPLETFLEHLDFHAAKKLHTELNSNMNKPILKIQKNSSSKKGTKRKSTSKELTDRKVKTISSFFKPV